MGLDTAISTLLKMRNCRYRAAVINQNQGDKPSINVKAPMWVLNAKETKKADVFSEGYVNLARNCIVFTLLECKTSVVGDSI
jgi:hypothetical protein